MDEFDIVDIAEAGERVTIDGDSAPVFHARQPHIEQQELADRIWEHYEAYEPEENHRLSERLLDNASPIIERVHPMVQTSFRMGFDDVPTDIALAIQDAGDDFPYDPKQWEASPYDEQDPTAAEVVAAFVSLVNACWCIDRLEDATESEDEDISLYSDEYFDAQVTQGLLVALRDAFVYDSPKQHISPVVIREKERAIVDAVENVVDLELSDTHLHGLLLADWNKRVRLQAASSFGQEESAKQGLIALENLAKGLSDDE